MNDGHASVCCGNYLMQNSKVHHFFISLNDLCIKCVHSNCNEDDFVPFCCAVTMFGLDVVTLRPP